MTQATQKAKWEAQDRMDYALDFVNHVNRFGLTSPGTGIKNQREHFLRHHREGQRRCLTPPRHPFLGC